MKELITKQSQRLRALILDVDGVLTDGTFYLTPDGEEIKQFHTQDGFGLKQLQNEGITVAIISSRKSNAVMHRMRELGIQHVYQGAHSKLDAYEQLLRELQLTDNDVAYMGDDIPDLALMIRAGLSIAPANAVYEVKQQARWVTDRAGGQGSVREVCDFILHARRSKLA